MYFLLYETYNRNIALGLGWLPQDSFAVSSNNLSGLELGWHVCKLGLGQPSPILEAIVACQAHPALVKIGLALARILIFNRLLVYIRLVKVLRTPCVCYKRLVVHYLSLQ